MRIDPKVYTLDANERYVIAEALKCYAASKRRFLNRYVATPTSRTRHANEQAENHETRAADLLTKLA